MAVIRFDATSVHGKKKFRFTFGRSSTDTRWTDRREYTFAELTALLKAEPQVGAKNGECYTPAIFDGYLRRMDHSTQIDVAVLDSDCGHDLDYIMGKIAERGWRAIIHSTHSHLTTRSVLAAAPIEKWLEENRSAKGDPLPIGAYMAKMRGFLPHIIGIAEIEDEISEGRARNKIIGHAPCPKFRILIPLSSPWLSENFASQQMANNTWRDRIGALAYALGLHHDQSCVDTSRLFYLPRVRDEEARASYVCESLDGDDCDIWNLSDPTAETRTDGGALAMSDFRTNGSNVYPLMPRGLGGYGDKKTYVDSDGQFADLTSWAADKGNRFEIVTALRARGKAAFSHRRSGVKHHLAACPCAGEHITGGEEPTGTFVVNASQISMAQLGSVSSGFAILCSHNACKGRDRLDFLKALLEKGHLEISDLHDQRFLTGPDLSGIDVSRIVERSKRASQPHQPGKLPASKSKSQFEAEKSGANINEYLYKNLPGALGAIFDYIVVGSVSPQPVLALGASLAFCASVIGQRVIINEYETSPNIYALGIAASGAGKDWPMKAIHRMAHAAGMTADLTGVENLTSDAGVEASVNAAPRQVMLIDEISHALRAISDPRSPPHMKGIVATFLKLFTSSGSRYKSKNYADLDKVKIINKPCVSMFATCTPKGFLSALNQDDIESGLLSRVVVFDVGSHDPIPDKPGARDVPEKIVKWMHAWRAVAPIPDPIRRIGGEAVIDPRPVMMTPDADAIYEDFKIEMYEARQAAKKSGKDALFVRAHEYALKFALIRACAVWPEMSDISDACIINEENLKIDAAAMRWAVDLSRACLSKMIETSDDIASTDFEKNRVLLKRAIKSAGVRGLTDRDLARSAVGRMPRKTLEDLLGNLVQAGEVDKFNASSRSSGRQREAWVHKTYWGDHNRHADDDDEEELDETGTDA